MARGREQHIEHLLRRAAFGAVEEDVTRYAAMPFNAAVDRLLTFERFPTTSTPRSEPPATSA